METHQHGHHQHQAAPKKKAPSPAQAFINTHLHDAIAVYRRTQVPVSVTLAQSALESGWGHRVVNNAYFGVKGHAPDGAQTKFKTHEYTKGRSVAITGSFRAYRSYREAADDYADALRKYFPLAFVTRAGIPFVAHLSRYATNPHYVQDLQSIIRKYHLDQHDIL